MRINSIYMQYARYLAIIVSIPVVWSLIGGQVILAHTFGGSIEKKSGEFLFDIGFSPEALEAERPILWDFTLMQENGEEVEYSSAWIRIEQGPKTVFASGIHRPSFGKTVLTYTFPQEGDYTLYVRFQNDEGAIAEETFPLYVLEAREEKGGFPVVPLIVVGVFILGLVIGFGTSIFFERD